MERKAEALIPIAEATNGVRSRARPGAFTFQVRPTVRPLYSVRDSHSPLRTPGLKTVA